ncbi:MAG: glycerol-3-phosphate dehydrogenase, partial [Phycisphaerales bacterium]|nr:glycerol-3-phosphate dehydrogenase [Phycisphaerales bacterium]
MWGGRLARVSAHATGRALRVAIIGAGQMGGAMAAQAARAGADVSIWDRDGDAIDAIARGDCPPRLPGLRLPRGIRACRRVEDALEGAPIIVSAVPTQGVRSAWRELAAHIADGAMVVSTAKGFELGSLLRPTEVLRDALAVHGVG